MDLIALSTVATTNTTTLVLVSVCHLLYQKLKTFAITKVTTNAEAINSHVASIATIKKALTTLTAATPTVINKESRIPSVMVYPKSRENSGSAVRRFQSRRRSFEKLVGADMFESHNLIRQLFCLRLLTLNASKN
uniref:Uncharacterized protein n=1 Tax=Glossina austeni TaxID=7395 RepID=A0A1A9UX89_GLOAU